VHSAIAFPRGNFFRGKAVIDCHGSVRVCVLLLPWSLAACRCLFVPAGAVGNPPPRNEGNMLQGDRPAAAPGKGPPLSSSLPESYSKKGQQGCMQRSCCTALLALTARTRACGRQQNGVFFHRLQLNRESKVENAPQGDVG